ncbi:unnamed protein product [Mytilus coruscus]|uniref:Up-regulator of cell proliferation-like domain-containing protein n=1 Tax=Mytilus coruscus TaxID=42192 RepID=A0A6J8A785_MYTCO|nr:unnamed protein product [Mytilus coruscus]
MLMKTHQGYMYWLFLYGLLAFEFKCPEEISRNLRVKEACSDKSPDHYSCLLDQQSNTYTESCTDPADFVRPGQKYVIGVFRKNIDCDTLRYQPFKFWSQQLSQCVFAKSRCNEAGQIMLNFGSTFGDSACRCDHTQGYAFVHSHKEHCYCIPSNEDCTCYKKLCPSSYILTSDRKYFTSTELSPKVLYTILIVLLLVKTVEKEPIDDFELFIKKVGLDSFYPETMEISDAMKIYNKDMTPNLRGIAIMFIRNLVMLNYTCRDKLLEKYINKIPKYHTTVNKKDQNDNDSNIVNPLDLIVAVFKCSSPMLKQILAAKLFMCKLAIPLVFPALGKDRMLVSI